MASYEIQCVYDQYSHLSDAIKNLLTGDLSFKDRMLRDLWLAVEIEVMRTAYKDTNARCKSSPCSVKKE